MANLPALGSDGKLPAYAWPGGYPIIYLDSENSVLCAECATKSLLDPDEVPQFKPVAGDAYMEGSVLQCESCNVDIESAYGDPEDEDEGDEEPDEPDEDALTTSDGRNFYQYGKLVLTVGEDEDRDEALVRYMNQAQFWPDCWSISDHGNAHRIDLTEAYKAVANG